jgi:MOSC domain-containing protein YiiM
MWSGRVESIFIASEAEAPMQAISEVQAVPGVGLQGDRYAQQKGTFSKPLPDREITLIEAEAVEALQGEYDTAMATAEARRNIVTRGVPLNHLVGREFQLGEVKIRGIRLCEPCSHLEGLTGKPVMKYLAHRGGLRAQILSAGMLRVGDVVREI